MLVLIRGGGDLATGVALRLIRSGLRVVVTEIAQPLAVRRTVSFAEAVYSGETTVEGITAHCINDPTDSISILMVLGKQQVPVLVDPVCSAAKTLHASVVVDGRMTKRAPEAIGYSPSLYIGLGPGFEAGVNCQAVIETRRGPMLGRVYGAALRTRIPACRKAIRSASCVPPQMENSSRMSKSAIISKRGRRLRKLPGRRSLHLSRVFYAGCCIPG